MVTIKLRVATCCHIYQLCVIQFEAVLNNNVVSKTKVKETHFARALFDFEQARDSGVARIEPLFNGLTMMLLNQKSRGPHQDTHEGSC
jgi:hypothetical protein